MGLVGFLLGEDLVAVVWFFFVIIKEITHVFLVFLIVYVLGGGFGCFCFKGAESFGLHTCLERLFDVGLVLGPRFLSW